MAPSMGARPCLQPTRARRSSACITPPTAAGTPRRPAPSTKTRWASRCPWRWRSREEPSTGSPLKYLHIFFDIGSHKPDAPSYIAFFELPDTPADETTFAQKWGFDLHLAMRVDSHEDLAAWKKRLRDGDIAVKGPIDHGICSSIYFSDPNGYVLEFAAENVQERATMAREMSEARANLEKWNAWKAAR